MIGQVRDRVPGAWTATATSIVGWFVLDSTTSVARGYPGNALLNASMMIVLGAGLWLSRPVRGMRTIARSPDTGY